MELMLDEPIAFRHASFRYFTPDEHHIDRVCREDVLLLVFRGTLRFSEDGRAVEVGAGEYYIQRRGLVQSGERPSDAPAYFYVHFIGTWGSEGERLPLRGRFDPEGLMPEMQKLDSLAHGKGSLTAKSAAFFGILLALRPPPARHPVAEGMMRFLCAHWREDVTLARLSAEFHFGKNYLIRLFREAYGQTPIDALIGLRLNEAARLLEATSETAQAVARLCGFSDYPNFYRAFCRRFGRSPAAFRARARS